VIRKSRWIVALGIAAALSISSYAYGTGASDNNAIVDAKITPSKLDKKKFKPVNLFLGVRNEATVTGTQSNPASEYISSSKNVKIKLKKAPLCDAPLANGIPTEQARAACPAGSFLGEGEANVTAPGGTVIDNIVVSVFNGPGPGQLRLHTYSPNLAAASPIVPGTVEKSNAGPKWGYALNVPNAPETGALMITKFNATVEKRTKTVTARCKPKTFKALREVTYKDGSSETATTSQKCKVKKKKK
jgi:hypothetical protein